MTNTLTIYIKNFNSTTNNKHSEIELPITDDKLQDTLLKIGITGKDDYIITVCYFTDTFGNEYDIDFYESESIYDLNGKAKIINSFNKNEIKVLSALLINGYLINDVIEIIQNQDYTLYTDCYSMADVAKEIVTEEEIENFKDNLPKHLRDYFTFDYEKYGQNLEFNYKFVRVDIDMFMEIFK